MRFECGQLKPYTGIALYDQVAFSAQGWPLDAEARAVCAFKGGSVSSGPVGIATVSTRLLAERPNDTLDQVRKDIGKRHLGAAREALKEMSESGAS